MSIEETLHIIDGLLHCELDPTYIEMLECCKRILTERHAADEMQRKADSWPHCPVCGKPFKFGTWTYDVRRLYKPCRHKGAAIMKYRPQETHDYGGNE